MKHVDVRVLLDGEDEPLSRGDIDGAESFNGQFGHRRKLYPADLKARGDGWDVTISLPVLSAAPLPATWSVFFAGLRRT